MDTTSPSLLERLRTPADQEAWTRFVRLYTPMLYSWARGVGLQDQDAADLTQDVLTLLVQKLPEFTYDPQKSFRAWLHKTTVNLWRSQQRKQGAKQLDLGDISVSDPEDSGGVREFEEAEYRRYVVRRALELMQTDFQPTSWKAFWECEVRGRGAAEVASELGISVGALYVAKSRVLARLRQELKGLLE